MVLIRLAGLVTDDGVDRVVALLAELSNEDDYWRGTCFEIERTGDITWVVGDDSAEAAALAYFVHQAACGAA